MDTASEYMSACPYHFRSLLRQPCVRICCCDNALKGSWDSSDHRADRHLRHPKRVCVWHHAGTAMAPWRAMNRADLRVPLRGAPDKESQAHSQAYNFCCALPPASPVTAFHALLGSVKPDTLAGKAEELGLRKGAWVSAPLQPLSSATRAPSFRVCYAFGLGRLTRCRLQGHESVSVWGSAVPT